MELGDKFGSHSGRSATFYGPRGNCPRHKVSKRGLEVDQEKVEAIEKGKKGEKYTPKPS